jgi:hypothetical protein
MKLEKNLKEFSKKAIEKYNKGRKEHNDDLTRLDYDKEIQDELMDLVNYLELKRYYKPIWTPKNWRMGQTLFNFLSTLDRDPFHIQDEEFIKLWHKFFKHYEP